MLFSWRHLVGYSLFAGAVTADAFLAQMRALGYRAHTLRGGNGPSADDLLGPPLERAPGEALVSVVFMPRT